MQEDKNTFSEYQRKGKRLIPNILHQLNSMGGLQEINWTDTIVPEILWIALLNKKYGFQETLKLTKPMSQMSCFFCGNFKAGLISFYPKICNEAKKTIVSHMKRERIIEPIKEGLKSLLYFYPKNPLCFIYEEAPISLTNKEEELLNIKDVVTKLFDKYGTFSNEVKGILFLLGVYCGQNILSPNMQGKMEIANYPSTEKSKDEINNLNAFMNSFIGFLLEEHSEWRNYFWNRGLELESCISLVEEKFGGKDN